MPMIRPIHFRLPGRHFPFEPHNCYGPHVRKLKESVFAAH